MGRGLARGYRGFWGRSMEVRLAIGGGYKLLLKFDMMLSLKI